MALKPALEIASSFLGRVCSSLQPIETLAKQVGIFLVFSVVSDILDLCCRFEALETETEEELQVIYLLSEAIPSDPLLYSS